MFNPNDELRNEKTIELLIRQLETLQVTGFLGAGASIDLYGSWTQLLSRLMKEAEDSGFAQPNLLSFWRKYAKEHPEYVAYSILQSLGRRGVFEEALTEMFQPKGRSTNLHDRVAQLPINGVMTTNYDVAIHESLRAANKIPNPFTWRDETKVTNWFNGKIFKEEEYRTPVFHLHGKYDDPNTIVLDTQRYREAYTDSAVNECIRNTWRNYRLLVLGFSFSDRWFRTIVENTMTRLASGEGMKHFTLVGIHPDEVPFLDEVRRLYQFNYNSRVIFYRVTTNHDGSEDHNECVQLLDYVLDNLSDDCKKAKSLPIKSLSNTLPPGLSRNSESFDDDIL